MDSETHSSAAGNDDKREIFAQLHEHSVAIASLQSGVESLASSTESGFRNIGNRIDDLGQSIRAARPQLGVIASILIAGTALIVSLAGFALKSAVLPVQHDVSSMDKRIATIERKMETRYSDHDDRQDAEIRYLEKICDLIVSDAVGSKLNEAHTHPNP